MAQDTELACDPEPRIHDSSNRFWDFSPWIEDPFKIETLTDLTKLRSVAESNNILERSAEEIVWRNWKTYELR